MDDFRVAAALINAFHLLIEDNAHAEEYLRIIRERLHVPNQLGAYVTNRNINRRRASFRNIEADAIGADEFPVLTQEDLTLFALGSYHIKLARSYYSEHVRNGVYQIEVARDGAFSEIVDFGIEPENAMLLRARIQSRHARARQYYTYVMIQTNQQSRNHFELLLFLSFWNANCGLLCPRHGNYLVFWMGETPTHNSTSSCESGQCYCG